MKFSLRKQNKVGWKGWNAWPYSKNTDFANASALYIEVTTHHGKVKSKKSDRVYYVIEGEGRFIINNEEFPVQKNDVLIVPKNTPYDYYAKKRTTLRLFLVHLPAFDPEAEVKLEQPEDA